MLKLLVPWLSSMGPFCRLMGSVSQDQAHAAPLSLTLLHWGHMHLLCPMLPPLSPALQDQALPQVQPAPVPANLVCLLACGSKYLASGRWQLLPPLSHSPIFGPMGTPVSQMAGLHGPDLACGPGVEHHSFRLTVLTRKAGAGGSMKD